jgi:hypothetical protein
MATKKTPYINKFTGDMIVVSKQRAKRLSEDWMQPKLTTNEKGETVYRFEISSTVKGPDGKIHAGTAVVDLSETEAEKVKEAADGVGSTK